MFRSLLCQSGRNLKRTTAIIKGESSSSSLAAKYLFRIQNQNVFVISNSRVTSTFYSFSTTSNGKSSDSSNSCGLSETEASAVSGKLNFKTNRKPNSILKLLKAYGFTESHISKVVSKDPSILQSDPNETLKPKLDFYISKGIHEIDLAEFISNFPGLLTPSLDTQIIPSFDTLRSIVQSDQVKRVMVNIELLRNEGVAETNISVYLIKGPRTFNGDVDRFKEIVEKVKEMGFHHSQTTFLAALHVFRTMSEASLRKKLDVYKRLGGWSEDQVQSAFRKSPTCVKASETRILAVFNFLLNEMHYDSSIVAENPIVFTCTLQGKIIPRFSVIRVLVSKGLIKEDISLSTLATLVDELFLEQFVEKYEQEVPRLMKVFEGRLNYQELLLN